jgi:hypothetical protein
VFGMAEEVSERQKLEGLAAYLGEARARLVRGDWAASQGALREFFNRMPEFLETSKLPAINKGRLDAVVEFVNDSRDRLVQGMEFLGGDLERTIGFYHLYERLDSLKETLRSYLAAWYKEETRES